MNTKRIVLLAVMLALPITANADYTYVSQNTPALVANNGTVTIAGEGPYQTVTPEAHADEHIASTKYVIGAYNDTIAAINRLDADLSSKQIKIMDMDTDETMDTETIQAQDFIDMITNEPDIDDLSGSFVSAYATAMGIKSQRVEVYTNWDDDTDKTEVPFVTATGD